MGALSCRGPVAALVRPKGERLRDESLHSAQLKVIQATKIRKLINRRKRYGRNYILN